jgi:hypothetical protein
MTTPKKYALASACSYKKNPDSKSLALNGTINDANNMRIFLTRRGYNFTFMRDDLNTTHPLFPTKQNILHNIKNILSNSKTGDNIVIYYSGHGVQTANIAISGIANDTELDGKDEAIVPCDFNCKTNTGLLIDDELNDYLRKYSVSGTNVLIITDCCHSGTLCDLKYSYKYTGNVNTVLTNISDNHIACETVPNTPRDLIDPIKANVITLSGCRDSEVSNEAYLRFSRYERGQVQGVLTGAFIYVINTTPALTRDIFSVVKGIMRYTNRYGQRPKVSSTIPIHIEKQYRTVLNSTNTTPPRRKRSRVTRRNIRRQPKNQKVSFLNPYGTSIFLNDNTDPLV